MRGLIIVQLIWECPVVEIMSEQMQTGVLQSLAISLLAQAIILTTDIYDEIGLRLRSWNVFSFFIILYELRIF